MKLRLGIQQINEEAICRIPRRCSWLGCGECMEHFCQIGLFDGCLSFTKFISQPPVFLTSCQSPEMEIGGLLSH